MRKFKMLAAAMLLIAGVMGATSVQAVSYTLSSDNSSAQLDPNSQSGLYSWKIDGNDILSQQWFWYRVGPTGGENSIDTIGTPTVTQPNSGTVLLGYTSSSFQIDVNYTLQGGPLHSGSASMGDFVTITNLTSSPLDFHFFEYSDYGLSNNPKSDTGNYSYIPSAPSAPLAGVITQKGNWGAMVMNLGVPLPSHWKIAYYGSLLDQLNSGNPTTLSDSSNALSPGDITWALEWDLSIPANSLAYITNLQLVTGVPEPGILLLLGSGLIGALVVRKRFGKNA
jgi:hypothetical protein